MQPIRPRLTPAIADVRRAVRHALTALPATRAMPGSVGVTESRTLHPENSGISVAQTVETADSAGLSAENPEFPTEEGGSDERGEESATLVLVALSGGPDSLALAAATAFEAPRAGIRAGAVIVDHALQPGSADVAAAAAQQASDLGLDPVIVKRVTVGSTGGTEAAARAARYGALGEAAAEAGASAILLGHTLDDQAETVLLGLARGSGAASLHGMAVSSPLATPPAATLSPGESRQIGVHEGELAPSGGSHAQPRAREGDTAGQVTFLRPLLGIRRSETVQFCADSGLRPWLDPQNSDHAFTRVRVRETVLPMLESELGPGIAEALARTAEQLREDSAALDHFAEELIEDLAEHAEAGLSLEARGLEANPPALRQRIIRLAVQSEFGASLSRAQTLEVARLVTDWHGQKPLHLPGVRVERKDGLLVFTAATGEN